ncbi:MAG: hypothetical protein U1D30_01575 [Planctomycetota bacterium]
MIAKSGMAINGNPVLMGISSSELSLGSGKVVFFSDAGTAVGSIRSNDGLLLNAIHYVAVPELSSLTLVSLPMVVSLAMIVRRKARGHR